MNLKRNSIILALSLLGLNIMGVTIQSNPLTFPYQQIASMLRLFSSEHPVGNVFAWIAYVGICIAPIILLKWLKKKSDLHDVIIFIYSFLLFIFLYIWINPRVIEFGSRVNNFTPMLLVIFGSILQLLLLLFFSIEIAQRIKEFNNLSLLKVLLNILAFGAYAIIFVVMGIHLSEFFSNIIFSTTTSTSGFWMNSTNFDPSQSLNFWPTFMVIINFIVYILPYGIMLHLIYKLHDFVSDHYRHGYSDDNQLTLQTLVDKATRYILIILVSQIAIQLLFVVSARFINMGDFKFGIPFTSIGFILLLLFFNQFYKQNKELADENKGFI